MDIIRKKNFRFHVTPEHDHYLGELSAILENTIGCFRLDSDAEVFE